MRCEYRADAGRAKDGMLRKVVAAVTCVVLVCLIAASSGKDSRVLLYE